VRRTGARDAQAYLVHGLQALSAAPNSYAMRDESEVERAVLPGVHAVDSGGNGREDAKDWRRG
jgi:hypothetical protein